MLDDWFEGRRRRRDTEERMAAVLDILGLTALVASIPGLSVVAAAAILAETGDPHRFTYARALVKHAARYAHLTSREHNRLKPTQAQAAVAAALLRQLHAGITPGRAWDGQIATYGTRPGVLESAA